jgi:hypothetical protein
LSLKELVQLIKMMLEITPSHVSITRLEVPEISAFFSVAPVHAETCRPACKEVVKILQSK